MNHSDCIRIVGAREHNLKSVSLDIPKNKLVVVTGVSGSGKSSLIFDVLYREAESRYLGSFSSFARQFMGKMRKPDVESIESLSPAIANDQKAFAPNARSTVGTITGIYDSLRLLFARTGHLPSEVSPFPLNRSLFSFNSPEGACPECKGLGVEDFLDPELLISDASKTLREGALVITAPNGYIIYSQVTLDVLDQVCRSEGFHIDIPWKELTPEQKHIVLYGSNKIEIPFGKHPLESRMKWSGITAKPRELGYYKGILPIMEAILQRDRNKNILRFVRTVECRVCQGSRLNQHALSVKIDGYTIAGLAALQLDEMQQVLQQIRFSPSELLVATPVINQVSKQVDLLKRLGLAYLTANRESTTLSGGETRRLRLASQAGMGLSGMICIFDEPSVGLHPHDVGQLIEILKDIRDKGNTVIVVEHDETFIQHADWLIDIGPGPGLRGGEVLFNGTLQQAGSLPQSGILRSRTLSFLYGFEHIPLPAERRPGSGRLTILGAASNNLKAIDVSFKLKCLNVVTGVSGAGKSSLINHTLGSFLRNRLQDAGENEGIYREIKGWETIGKLISVDQSPIGRTPRSNPATYTGMFDHIRDLFAKLPESVSRGYEKSRFSFNTAGGCCESCEGAGYRQIGMHFMGNVEVLCEACEGRRFDPETLEIRYPALNNEGRSRNIFEVLEMSVAEGLVFFREEPKILRYLETLDSLGLGYLTLGQRSSTLSGGEAQRIKLATELAKPQSGHTLYIMDEPTTGLHQADTGVLLQAIARLISQGNTVIVIEHHPGFIAAADHVIDLGPGSGRDGGFLLFSGTPEEMINCEGSHSAMAYKEYRILNNEYRNSKFVSGESQNSLNLLAPAKSFNLQNSLINIQYSIILNGVCTHNLKNINVTIPHNKITVLTGVSGSGKSSMAFDTIFAEGQSRFLESFSPYVRARLGIKEHADFESISGLTPTFAVDQRGMGRNPRSTVGTQTGIYDHYRLLFSRLGIREKGHRLTVSSSLFSFNHEHGACKMCNGLGYQTVCDQDKLITHPGKSLLAGAMDGTKTGKFYGDPVGQYTATLQAVTGKYGFDFSQPWNEVPAEARRVAMEGTGDELYEVRWNFIRDNRSGEHHFTGPWKGLVNLVNEEYNRKHADHRGDSMMTLMKTVECALCKGSRLQPEALLFTIHGKNIAELSSMPVTGSILFLTSYLHVLEGSTDLEIAIPLVGEALRKLEFITGLGLSYLTLDRLSTTLSGGEAQRLRLAGQLGSGMTGITYVLDEPTLGLHPGDTANLMKIIRSLQEAGNTVVIVEHDREVILASDLVIDIGRGAGKNGGYVVAAGTPPEIMNNPDSVTGPYLSGQFKTIHSRRQLTQGLAIKNAAANNLKGFDLEIPASGIIAITGVSGSGKSTLMFDVILASWESKKPVGCATVDGFNHFRQVVAVHQQSGFNSPLSTPATYTGIFNHIRDIYAALPEPKQAGLGKNSFSYLNREARCPVCEGTGQITISMDFLSDVTAECEECKGKRYCSEVLEFQFHGKNIAETLEMTVTEACIFFSDHKSLPAQLRMLEKVGLGYLALGQPLDTLSGGEAQRLALAAELMKPGKGATLYLFEEPSTGLHFRDIEHLLTLFHQLADQGNTLLIIEHDQMVIAQADHIIELGPAGGDAGGYLVSSGPVQT
ncbi:MAG: excinuclease ABC subunit UvrA [Bacteroidales bacterium]